MLKLGTDMQEFAGVIIVLVMALGILMVEIAVVVYIRLK